MAASSARLALLADTLVAADGVAVVLVEAELPVVAVVIAVVADVAGVPASTADPRRGAPGEDEEGGDAGVGKDSVGPGHALRVGVDPGRTV